jgi:hypothetical protein
MKRRELLKGAGSAAAVAGAVLGPRVALAAGGQPDSEAAAALEELQRALDQLEADFASPTYRLRTPQDFAEARRMLLHVLLHALETWLEADPARPFFRPFIHQHKKLLGDNPDARYFSAVIDDRHRYRIRGNLAGATYTSFTIELAPGPDGPGVGTTLNDTQFEADANGDYEIVLSRDRVPGNWMQLPEGASSITTRHYYERRLSINNDRLHTIPIDIGNLDPAPPRPVADDAGVATGIRRVAAFLRGNVVAVNAERSPAWVSREPNRFVPPVIDDSNKAVGYAAVDNVYAMAPFVLGPDQALVIRGRFPKCRFANLVLWNRFMQTLDYETRTISLNRAQTARDAQGNFEMIVAHRDPGRPNWLDTEGRPYGLMFWRFQLPEEEIQPLETEVITL